MGPEGFKVYLWADSDQRTVDTADALAQGFEQSRIPKQDLTVGHLPPKNVDPLFHPFQAGCGKPDSNTLASTVAEIENGRKQAAQKLKSSFEDLYAVLDCKAPPCNQLKLVVESVTICTDGACSPGKCESPIAWCGMLNEIPSPGQFPYASSASEAFLLEYANNMAPNLVGWGKG